MVLAATAAISTCGHGLLQSVCNRISDVPPRLLKPHDTRSTELRSHIMPGASGKHGAPDNAAGSEPSEWWGNSLRTSTPFRATVPNLISPARQQATQQPLPKLQGSADIDGDVLCQMDSERLVPSAENLLNNASPINCDCRHGPCISNRKRDPTRGIRLAVKPTMLRELQPSPGQLPVKRGKAGDG